MVSVFSYNYSVVWRMLWILLMTYTPFAEQPKEHTTACLLKMLGQTLKNYVISYHSYADDTQVYAPLSPYKALKILPTGCPKKIL